MRCNYLCLITVPGAGLSQGLLLTGSFPCSPGLLSVCRALAPSQAGQRAPSCCLSFQWTTCQTSLQSRGACAWDLVIGQLLLRRGQRFINDCPMWCCIQSLLLCRVLAARVSASRCATLVCMGGWSLTLNSPNTPAGAGFALSSPAGAIHGKRELHSHALPRSCALSGEYGIQGLAA